MNVISRRQAEWLATNATKNWYYDPDAPTCLRWKARRPKGKRRPNSPAGSKIYKRFKVRCENELWECHQIVWVLHNGLIPEGHDILHADGDGFNNKLNNLRLVTEGELNRGRSFGKQKYIGVCQIKDTNRYRAAIRTKNSIVHIGYFKSPIEAARAWDQVAHKLGRTKLNFPEWISDAA
jgi:hypothetical protein